MSFNLDKQGRCADVGRLAAMAARMPALVGVAAIALAAWALPAAAQGGPPVPGPSTGGSGPFQTDWAKPTGRVGPQIRQVDPSTPGALRQRDLRPEPRRGCPSGFRQNSNGACIRT